MYQRNNRERIDGRDGGVGRALGVGVGRGVTIGVTVGVALGVGLAAGVGVGVGPGSPPSAVQRIVPLSPTTMPLNASLAKETSLRVADVPLIWSVQLMPASALCEIRPPPPTANPLVGC